MREPDAVELAIWFHDAIYIAGSPENELESARLFERHATGCIPPNRVRTVFDLIIVTEHRQAPVDDDQALLIDIDLSSFGQSWEQMSNDSSNVRREFAHLSDAVFYAGQEKFLKGLLARKHFCYSKFFRERHEAQARANIVQYLESIAP